MIVPPVAVGNGACPITFSVVPETFFHPSFESTYKSVTDSPSVIKVVSFADPPIFSDPLGEIVKLFV